MRPFNQPISATLNVRSEAMCYTYSSFRNGGTRKSMKRNFDDEVSNSTNRAEKRTQDSGKKSFSVPVTRDESLARSGCNPLDRENSICTRYGEALPESWISMHRTRTNVVRNNEEFINSIIDRVNIGGDYLDIIFSVRI